MLKRLFISSLCGIFSLCSQQMPQTATLPSAGPAVSEGLGISAEAAYLLWTANQDGLGYATTNYKNNAPVNPKKGAVHSPEPTCSSGFKVGLSASLPHDEWNVEALYTWFHENSCRTHVSKNRVYPTMRRDWLTGGDFSPFFFPRNADGIWKLSFNAVDLDWGRNSFISRYLSWRLGFGLKGSWQNQDYLIRYETVDNSLIQQNERIHIAQNYWGVGVRFSNELKTYLAKNWSIRAKGALATLYSHFSSSRSDRIDVNTLETQVVDSANRFYSLKPVGEWSLGLVYENWIKDDSYHCLIAVNYEAQIWWSQNQFLNFLDPSAHGDLALQGLTVEFRFDF